MDRIHECSPSARPDPRCPGRWPLALAIVLGAVALTAGAQEVPIVYSVSYVSAGAIYLDGGRFEGLAVGDRLRLLRNGEVIAEVEVAFVADHSASCRIVSERRDIHQEDQAVLISRAPREGGGPSVPSPAPPVVEEEVPRRALPSFEPRRDQARKEPWARPSGSLSVRLQQFQPGQTSGGDFQESTTRLNLRLREMGRKDLDLRVRMRSRQDSRDGSSSRNDDRLYELSLSYDPPEGRLSFALGRLGASPFVSIGYLDGALAQLRVLPTFYVGGFYGSRPVLEELGFQSEGTKLGAFLRYSTHSRAKGLFGEVVMAGTGEYEKGGIVSREYLSLESRIGSGSRWYFYQRAELDLDRVWEEPAIAQPAQLSSVSVSGSYRFSDRVRTTFSYDQRRNFRTAETRELPEDFFDNLLRQGYRVTLYLGRPQGWNATASLGARTQEGGGDSTTSVGLSLYHGNVGGWNLLVGGDASFYSGGFAEGYQATLRAQKYFRRGHDLAFTLGSSSATVLTEPGTRTNQWARLSGTVQLPWRLFLVAETEYNTGDDLEGQRFILEIGYRF